MGFCSCIMSNSTVYDLLKELVKAHLVAGPLAQCSVELLHLRIEVVLRCGMGLQLKGNIPQLLLHSSFLAHHMMQHLGLLVELGLLSMRVFCT